MATSKSTVLGIRLDHHRRAWIEAEAARRGVSVRGLIEEMIDGAQAGEMMDAARGTAAPPARVTTKVHAAEGSETTSTGRPSASARQGGVNTATAPFGTAPGWSPRSGFGFMAAVPGGLVRGACSLTAGLIETTGRYGTNRLGRCRLVRRWAERSA
jgi:hypothetical protein